MNTIKIQEIIDFIINDVDLFNIFGNRVFYISSVNTQTETALYINILSENKQQDTNQTLVEFRVVSANTLIGPIDIKDIIDLLHTKFEKNHLEIGFSKYYQIELLNDLFIQLNVSKNYEGVTTMIFKNAK